MHERGSRGARALRVKNCFEHFVVDVNELECALGDCHRVGHNSSDPLPSKTQHGIEHESVIGIVGAVLMAARGEQHRWAVVVGQNCVHSGERACGIHRNSGDACVRVRATEHGQMEHTSCRQVESERLSTGHDASGCGRRDGPTHGSASLGVLGVRDTAQCVTDRTVTGTPAQVAFEQSRQICGDFRRHGSRCGVSKGGCRHHEPRSAKPALKRAGRHKVLLHGVQVFGCSEPADRRDRRSIKSVCGVDAGVHGLGVDQHCARPAVASVAAFAHVDISGVAQYRAQHPPGFDSDVEGLAVDFTPHEYLPRVLNQARGRARALTQARAREPVHATHGAVLLRATRSLLFSSRRLRGHR